MAVGSRLSAQVSGGLLITVCAKRCPWLNIADLSFLPCRSLRYDLRTRFISVTRHARAAESRAVGMLFGEVEAYFGLVECKRRYLASVIRSYHSAHRN